MEEPNIKMLSNVAMCVCVYCNKGSVKITHLSMS